ncbi:hypothetical protein H696_04394 [Fonticula alba]|uniref:Uncharacterized protein n=1 Tax=Fonticula alba TaxID=691883 RepID=A0A058Z3Z0_FONAL|nr:hypothetical protein H696_04394 [Fonticula alba]KCV68974.1 hypothetical protein H696_04394 [Fonticula alba]|eukprot:XP_009496545.1 hypothetical protein H696_04394 [Fonticula alba]
MLHLASRRFASGPPPGGLSAAHIAARLFSTQMSPDARAYQRLDHKTGDAAHDAEALQALIDDKFNEKYFDLNDPEARDSIRFLADGAKSPMSHFWNQDLSRDASRRNMYRYLAGKFSGQMYDGTISRDDMVDDMDLRFSMQHSESSFADLDTLDAVDENGFDLGPVGVRDHMFQRSSAIRGAAGRLQIRDNEYDVKVIDRLATELFQAQLDKRKATLQDLELLARVNHRLAQLNGPRLTLTDLAQLRAGRELRDPVSGWRSLAPVGDAYAAQRLPLMSREEFAAELPTILTEAVDASNKETFEAIMSNREKYEDRFYALYRSFHEDLPQGTGISLAGRAIEIPDFDSPVHARDWVAKNLEYLLFTRPIIENMAFDAHTFLPRSQEPILGSRENNYTTFSPRMHTQDPQYFLNNSDLYFGAITENEMAAPHDLTYFVHRDTHELPRAPLDIDEGLLNEHEDEDHELDMRNTMRDRLGRPDTITGYVQKQMYHLNRLYPDIYTPNNLALLFNLRVREARNVLVIQQRGAELNKAGYPNHFQIESLIEGEQNRAYGRHHDHEMTGLVDNLSSPIGMEPGAVNYQYIPNMPEAPDAVLDPSSRRFFTTMESQASHTAGLNRRRAMIEPFTRGMSDTQIQAYVEDPFNKVLDERSLALEDPGVVVNNAVMGSVFPLNYGNKLDAVEEALFTDPDSPTKGLNYQDLDEHERLLAKLVMLRVYHVRHMREVAPFMKEYETQLEAQFGAYWTQAVEMGTEVGDIVPSIIASRVASGTKLKDRSALVDRFLNPSDSDLRAQYDQFMDNRAGAGIPAGAAGLYAPSFDEYAARVRRVRAAYAHTLPHDGDLDGLAASTTKIFDIAQLDGLPRSEAQQLLTDNDDAVFALLDRMLFNTNNMTGRMRDMVRDLQLYQELRYKHSHDLSQSLLPSRQETYLASFAARMKEFRKQYSALRIDGRPAESFTSIGLGVLDPANTWLGDFSLNHRHRSLTSTLASFAEASRGHGSDKVVFWPEETEHANLRERGRLGRRGAVSPRVRETDDSDSEDDSFDEVHQSTTTPQAHAKLLKRTIDYDARNNIEELHPLVRDMLGSIFGEGRAPQLYSQLKDPNVKQMADFLSVMLQEVDFHGNPMPGAVQNPMAILAAHKFLGLVRDAAQRELNANINFDFDPTQVIGNAVYKNYNASGSFDFFNYYRDMPIFDVPLPLPSQFPALAARQQIFLSAVYDGRQDQLLRAHAMGVEAIDELETRMRARYPEHFPDDLDTSRYYRSRGDIRPEIRPLFATFDNPSVDRHALMAVPNEEAMRIAAAGFNYAYNTDAVFDEIYGSELWSTHFSADLPFSLPEHRINLPYRLSLLRELNDRVFYANRFKLIFDMMNGTAVPFIPNTMSILLPDTDRHMQILANSLAGLGHLDAGRNISPGSDPATFGLYVDPSEERSLEDEEESDEDEDDPLNPSYVMDFGSAGFGGVVHPHQLPDDATRADFVFMHALADYMSPGKQMYSTADTRDSFFPPTERLDVAQYYVNDDSDSDEDSDGSDGFDSDQGDGGQGGSSRPRRRAPRNDFDFPRMPLGSRAARFPKSSQYFFDGKIRQMKIARDNLHAEMMHAIEGPLVPYHDAPSLTPVQAALVLVLRMMDDMILSRAQTRLPLPDFKRTNPDGTPNDALPPAVFVTFNIDADIDDVEDLTRELPVPMTNPLFHGFENFNSVDEVQTFIRQFTQHPNIKFREDGIQPHISIDPLLEAIKASGKKEEQISPREQTLIQYSIDELNKIIDHNNYMYERLLLPAAEDTLDLFTALDEMIQTRQPGSVGELMTMIAEDETLAPMVCTDEDDPIAFYNKHEGSNAHTFNVSELAYNLTVMRTAAVLDDVIVPSYLQEAFQHTKNQLERVSRVPTFRTLDDEVPIRTNLHALRAHDLYHVSFMSPGQLDGEVDQFQAFADLAASAMAHSEMDREHNLFRLNTYMRGIQSSMTLPLPHVDSSFNAYKDVENFRELMDLDRIPEIRGEMLDIVRAERDLVTPENMEQIEYLLHKNHRRPRDDPNARDPALVVRKDPAPVDNRHVLQFCDTSESRNYTHTYRERDGTLRRATHSENALLNHPRDRDLARMDNIGDAVRQGHFIPKK